MEDIERYRTAVRSYPALQGLRIIPLGLLFLILPLQRLNLPILGGQGNCTLTLPLLLIAIGSWFWIGKIYENTFGKVESLIERKNPFIAEVIVLLSFVAVIIVENVLYQKHLGPPFSLIEFTQAAAGLFLGIKTRRWYYTLVGVLIGIASFLPFILGVGVGDAIYGTFGVLFTVLFGLSIIGVGVLDHMRLLSYFKPKGEDANAGNPG